jgi:hypothetical protein
MFDYQFWFALAGTLGTLYAAYWQRKSVIMTMEAQRANNLDGTVQPLAWWKSPPFVALFILACSLWGPYILSRLSAPTQLHSVSMGLSGQADILDHFLNATITISMDGNEIHTYQPKKAMAVAFHWPTDKDVDDTEDIQKSQVLDIRNSPLAFYIHPDQKFIDMLNRGAGINYAIIILPAGVSANGFSTMRQAKMEGAEILPAGAGGISVQLQRVR